MMAKILENKGWWGIPPNGTEVKDSKGTIVWPKRALGKLYIDTPEVGDTIVDNQKGKLLGFEVLEKDDGGGLITDDYYLKVKFDGYTYEKD
jgi:hypothetical protein